MSGFISTPTMQDIKRLDERIAKLEERLSPPSQAVRNPTPRVVQWLGENERDAVWAWSWQRSEPQHFSLFYRYRDGWQYSHDLNVVAWIPCEDEHGRRWLKDHTVPGDGGTFTEVLP